MNGSDGGGAAVAPRLGAGAAVRSRSWVERATPLAAGLALLTVVAFLPALDCGFVAWDDPQTVAGYGIVLRGLSLEGLAWAFTHDYFAHWLPLTVLSHMLDWELFGAVARGHHLTSLLLHAATVVLTFLLFRQATGERWRAAAVAALWAVHPLRVEPVVWVAARKDMLSGTLGLLALLLYVRWAQAPSRRRFGALLAVLTFGLLAKPMLVTLPIVMLLLDFWPLRRWALAAGPATCGARGRAVAASAWPLLREKLPLFAVALLVAAGAMVSQRLAGAMADVGALPLPVRIGNAFLSYARYLGDTLWPAGLAAFYPFPMVPEGWQLVLPAAALFVALTAGALLTARRWPWLVTGWVWFVVMVLPVSGLMQVGDQARADRYTYLPSIGLLAAVVWSAAEGARRLPRARPLLAAATAFALAGCVVATREAIPHWRDTEAVFRRMLAVTTDNHVGHLNLGTQLAQEGRLGEAIPHLREAVRIRPGLPLSWATLGSALRRSGDRAGAREALVRAVRLDPDLPAAHLQLAALLDDEGTPGPAIGHLAMVVAVEPSQRAAWAGIGGLLAKPGVAGQALPFVAAVARERPSPAVQQVLAMVGQAAARDAARTAPPADQPAAAVSAPGTRGPGRP